jgi:two-component system, OmpR family, osmolarity sensor histidine kinase EnvZ
MSLDIEQINSILGKFLDYARPHVVELQDINLSNVVSATVNAVNNSAKVAKDIVASYFVPEDLQVMADPVELSRVLNNLLENARRYGKSTIYPENLQNHTDLLPFIDNESPEDGAWQPTRMFDEPLEIAQVHISARIEGDWVVLAIKDQGNGVAPEVLNQLNVPFFRANEARTNTTGTGLGLAIVEKAVQGMQGKVRLSNWGTKVDEKPEDEDLRHDRSQAHNSGFMVEISLKRPPHKVAAQKAKAAQLANQAKPTTKVAQNLA